MVEHLTFFIILTIPLIILYAYDRKNITRYLGIGLLALFLDLIWDPIGISIGLWYYNSQPQILGMSVYMLLLYIHYLSFCYFLGNKANVWVKKWK
jgi:hypothetical protein